MDSLSAVLFDLDGTLIDTAPDFVRVLNQLRAEEQLSPLDPAHIREQVSNGARALVNLGFNCNEDDESFADLLERLLDKYLNNIAVETRLFDGLDALLKKLEAFNIPWGIVTNKPSRYTTPLIEQLNLDKRCAVAICPDHVTQRKPHPEPILKACEIINASPSTTLYVGDHVRDIESGNRAGNMTIAAAWGYIDKDDDIDSWGATHIADTPQKLFDFINTTFLESTPQHPKNRSNHA